jgi:threonine dehydratase
MNTDAAMTAAKLIDLLRPERVRDLDAVRQLAVETPLVEIAHELPNGNRVFLKLESAQPVRSFKIRGATYALVSHLDDLRRRGVVADSGGNHSQALAFAGARLGVPVKIIMASVVPKLKVETTRRFGATDGSFEIDTSPPDFVVAKEMAKRVAAREGRRYLSPYDDEDIIRGTATLVPEILRQLAERGADLPRTAHLPIGGGGLISGPADVAAELDRPFALYGHEIVGADSAARSFDSPVPVEVPGELSRYAEGLAVRVMGARPHQRLRDRKIEGVLVSTLADVGAAYDWYRSAVLPRLGVDSGDEEEVWSNLPEVSSMVAIAGLLRYLRESEARDQTHLVVVSGGNLDRTSARAAMAAWAAERGD